MPNMRNPIILQFLNLVPVIELEPFRFSTQERPLPSGQEKERLDWSYCNWRDALADAGIRGVQPICSGSWHVATKEFTDPTTLRAVLAVILREDEGGFPSDLDSMPTLVGGLALSGSDDEVLVEPTCCCDLSSIADWHAAASHRGSDWRTVWIGHPWLSMRFEEPWLVLSRPHESDTPEAAGWAFRPEQLERALAAAESELESFAGRLAAVLPMLGYPDDSGPVARRLAGLLT